MRQPVLTFGWLAALFLGLCALLIFLQGLQRDQHFGGPEIVLDLSRPSEWQRQSFRVWGDSQYTLYLTTVNHEPPFNVPFEGMIEVQVLDPQGRPLIENVMDGRLHHLRPDNMHWSNLAEMRLNTSPLRRWQLMARVIEGDPRFAGTHSTVLLRKAQAEPGMGGLVNYTMLFPALGLLLLAELLALALGWTGESWGPLLFTTPLVLGGLALVLWGSTL